MDIPCTPLDPEKSTWDNWCPDRCTVVVLLLGALGAALCVPVGTMLGLWFVCIAISPDLASGNSQVFARSLSSSVTRSDDFSTSLVQFGGTSLFFVYATVVNKLSKMAWNWGEMWPVLGFSTSVTEPAWEGNAQCIFLVWILVPIFEGQQIQIAASNLEQSKVIQAHEVLQDQIGLRQCWRKLLHNCARQILNWVDSNNKQPLSMQMATSSW